MENEKKTILKNEHLPFCLDQSAAARERILGDLRAIVTGILEAVRPISPVTAVVLIGGFGRGEGGMMMRDGAPRPVNDYDLMVVIPRRSMPAKRKIRRALAALAVELEKRLHVAVDLDVRDPSDLAAVPNIIAWYEAQAGNRIIWGDDGALSPMPEMDPAAIPPWDGTLLLFNRAGGLLIARRMMLQDRLKSAEDRIYFVIQISKSALALGDCLLIRGKKYHASYVERMRRAEGMDPGDAPDAAETMRRYAEALAQKVRPDFAPLIEKDLRGWFEDTVARHAAFFRWWEEKRLGVSFNTWRDYAGTARVKLGGKGCALKNIAANMLRLGPSPEFRRYLLPLRERLIDAMPLLLFEPTAENLARAAEILRLRPAVAGAAIEIELINRYVRLWH